VASAGRRPGDDRGRHAGYVSHPNRHRSELCRKWLRCDGEEVPFARHALERVSAAILELQS